MQTITRNGVRSCSYCGCKLSKALHKWRGFWDLLCLFAYERQGLIVETGLELLPSSPGAGIPCICYHAQYRSRTQGFENAKELLHQLSYTPNPCLLILDRVPLHRLVWLQTHHTVQAGLKLPRVEMRGMSLPWDKPDWRNEGYLLTRNPNSDFFRSRMSQSTAWAELPHAVLEPV